MPALRSVRIARWSYAPRAQVPHIRMQGGKQGCRSQGGAAGKPPRRRANRHKRRRRQVDFSWCRRAGGDWRPPCWMPAWNGVHLPGTGRLQAAAPVAEALAYGNHPWQREPAPSREHRWSDHPEDAMKPFHARAVLAPLTGLILTGALYAQDSREPGLLPPISLQAPFGGEPLVVSEANPAEPLDSPVGPPGRSTLDLLPPPPAAVPPPAPERAHAAAPSAAARGERHRPPGVSPVSPARRWWTAKSSSPARLWTRTARPAPAPR